MTERARLARIGDNLRLRAAVFATVRGFFGARGYLEVDTPAVVPSPGLDLHLDAFEVEAPRGYLSTSPELQMKRLLCGGLGRLYQIARCFRRGERGPRHNPEFTMLEWYCAGATLDSLMDETEALVRCVLDAHAESEHMPLARGSIDWRGPFLRMTVSEAFARFAGIEEAEMLRLARDEEDRYFLALVDDVEPGLATLGRPALLHGFPATQASLARRRVDRPELCQRFELYAGALELCNGFFELSDPHEQRERFEADQRQRRARAKPVYPIDERFLSALEEGMPDSAGNALGLDRLVALAAGADDIADVMPFPADWL
jgi:lysyl-tRNA synthetase class 2